MSSAIAAAGTGKEPMRNKCELRCSAVIVRAREEVACQTKERGTAVVVVLINVAFYAFRVFSKLSGDVGNEVLLRKQNDEFTFPTRSSGVGNEELGMWEPKFFC